MAQDHPHPTTRAIAELAPTGTLRVGVIEAPLGGVFFVRPDGRAGYRGVTVDLGAEIAAAAGTPVAYRAFPNTGECLDALCLREVDLAFMPVDAERRARAAFGAAYYQLESTYLASAESGIEDVSDVDRDGVRVVAIANTTTYRASVRTLNRTAPKPVRSIEEAIELMRGGEADAFALSRDSLRPLLTSLSGSRIVTGGFQRTTISVVVPANLSAAIGFASEVVEHAKTSGALRRAFDGAGCRGEAIAPSSLALER